MKETSLISHLLSSKQNVFVLKALRYLILVWVKHVHIIPFTRSTFFFLGQLIMPVIQCLSASKSFLWHADFACNNDAVAGMIACYHNHINVLQLYIPQ